MKNEKNEVQEENFEELEAGSRVFYDMLLEGRQSEYWANRKEKEDKK